MRFFKCGLIFFALCIFVFACSQSKTGGNLSQSADPELAGARKIYTEKCVACHRENGEGGKIKLETTEFDVPSYKTDRAINKPDEKLLDYIENGDDEMPAFKGNLSTEEMKALVKMIRTDFQGR